MSKTYISIAKRQRIASAAKHRCGYCQTQEAIIGMPLEIEHIIPTVSGGSSEEENLWLACPRCNRYKGNRTYALDEQTALRIPLFNPHYGNLAYHYEQAGIVSKTRFYLRKASAWFTTQAAV